MMRLTPRLALLSALLSIALHIQPSLSLGIRDEDLPSHHQAFFSSPSPNDGYEPAPLPVPNSTHSFWTHSAPDANVLAGEGSEGELTSEADVCVIGSGITGVSAAWHLVEGMKKREGEGLDIVVLEARDFCSGATGRNGGHLAEDTFSAFRSRIASHGLPNAIRAIQIESYTTDAIAGIIHSHGLVEKVDLVEGGRVSLQFDAGWMEGRRRDWEEARRLGVEVGSVEWFDEGEMKEIYGTSHGQGVKIPGRNLWPLKFVTELYKLANASLPSSSSLHLHTRTPVTAVSPLSPSSPSSSSSSSAHSSSSSSFSSTTDKLPRRWSLQTPRGPIACTSVLHATNAYASHLLPSFAGPDGIVPTRGQVIAVRSNATQEELSRSGWVGNRGFEYWFPRPVREGEDPHPLVILGGGREHETGRFEYYQADDSGIDEKVGKALREFLPGVFPGKFLREEEGGEVEMEWTGIMGFTKIGDPFVGPVLTPSPTGEIIQQVGQYISAGYSGHGMPRGFSCAEVSAGLILAELTNTTYELPEWFPTHYLTENRV